MLRPVDVGWVVGNLHTAFRLQRPEQQAMQMHLLRANFARHYAANAFFRAQCEQPQVTPDALQSFDDLLRIPLIPIRMFKQPNAHVLLSVPLTQIDLEQRSVGTGGIPSVARRDVTTTTTLSLGTFGLFREFFDVLDGAGCFLTPSPAEAPEMGMVRLLNVASAYLVDRVYLLREFVFRPEEAIAFFEGWTDRQTRHLFGPPPLISRLLRFMERREIRLSLDRGSYVIMSGGWARHTGESVKREAFMEGLQTYLGIRLENVRDTYAVIESNLMAFECEHHHKHVAPWCHVSVRDVRDLSVEMPVGRTGVIAILDSVSNAYPSYILTEDVGKITQDGECACGRVGQTITFHRRLKGAEIGCCAVSIDRFVAAQEIVEECQLTPVGAAARGAGTP